MTAITSYWTKQIPSLKPLLERNETNFLFCKDKYKLLKGAFFNLEHALEKKKEEEFFFRKDYAIRLAYSFPFSETAEKIAPIVQEIIRSLTCGEINEERKEEYRSHIPDLSQLEAEAVYYEKLATSYFEGDHFDLELALENLRCAAFCHQTSSAPAEAERIANLIALLTTPCKVPNLLKVFIAKCKERGVSLHFGDTEKERELFTGIIKRVFADANDAIEACEVEAAKDKKEESATWPWETSHGKIEEAKTKIEEYWKQKLVPELEEKLDRK